MTRARKPNSEDFLRFGILEFENGMIDSSWKFVSRAILADPDIELRKHAYQSYISRIIQKKFGENINISEFLEHHRNSHQM